MRTLPARSTLPALFLLATLAACAAEKNPAPAPAASKEPPLTREDTALVTVTAKVEAIDVPSREITLRGPMGNVETFIVDEKVKRLAEVKVGDEVTADYYVSLVGELRAPTAEEKAAPFAVVEASARAPKGTSPAGGHLQVLRMVATVTALDPATRGVTVKGPRGNEVTVRAREEENFKRLHVGDTIVVTYTQALAVSLNKVASK